MFDTCQAESSIVIVFKLDVDNETYVAIIRHVTSRFINNTRKTNIMFTLFIMMRTVLNKNFFNRIIMN